MLYEERKTTLKRAEPDAYASHMRDTLKPVLANGQALCLLSAAIGDPAESI